jgi:hypothetical protein
LAFGANALGRLPSIGKQLQGSQIIRLSFDNLAPRHYSSGHGMGGYKHPKKEIEVALQAAPLAR